MKNIFKQIIKKLTILSALCITTNCCVSQTGATAKLVDLIKDNYKLKYPNSWKLDTTKEIGPELFIFSPLENQADLFSENVNVIVQDLSGQNIDLAKYKQITDQQVMNLAPDGKIFKSLILKKDKQDLYKITYAMTQNKLRLKITSICFIKNNKAYLITFSSEFDKYDTCKKVGEQILNSFAVIK